MSNVSTTDQEYVRVLITEPDITSVTVVEQPNTVVVSDEDPNIVYISVNGTQGPAGATILTGEGSPTSSDGSVNDLYIDSLTGAFWGPKTEAGWGASPFYQPSGVSRHVHTQATASDTWLVTHALGGYPSVMVVDSASTAVIGEVSYLSTSQVRISFSAPFSGFAYLT